MLCQLCKVHIEAGIVTLIDIVVSMVASPLLLIELAKYFRLKARLLELLHLLDDFFGTACSSVIGKAIAVLFLRPEEYI